ncbi:MAG: hypothetical protein NTW19_15755 [Planctomycetota bacterium]|nr:hypothetical protein [Planctomycetota bacterium]
MKQAMFILMAAITINALAVAGFVGWLHYSGRLDRGRVDRVVAVLKPTIEQEKKRQEEADRLEEEAKKQAAAVARMEKIANGPLTLEDRIRTEAQGDDVATQRLERLQRETADLRRQLEMAKQLVGSQKAELDAQKKVFAETVLRDEKLKADQSFQQTVEMYEALKATQVKEIFQNLLKQGRQTEVLDYFAAMQQRKAAAVLKEFKTPQEMQVATDLMRRLRERGQTPPTDGVSSGGNPA